MNPLITNTPMPEFYNGDRITYRIPYTIAGELIVNAATANVEFPADTFLQTTDKPFEIWGVKLAASQLVNGVPVAAPAPGINKFWRVRMRSLNFDMLMTKNAQLVDTLVDADDSTWWWAPQPMTIVRAEGFTIAVDNLLAANQLRAEVTYRGYQLIVKPASETR